MKNLKNPLTQILHYLSSVRVITLIRVLGGLAIFSFGMFCTCAVLLLGAQGQALRAVMVIAASSAYASLVFLGLAIGVRYLVFQTCRAAQVAFYETR